MIIILYILSIIGAYRVVYILIGSIKERKKRKEDIDSWNRFKKK